MLVEIPQKAFLFSGSIESNIKFGKKEATAENIWNALEIAQAKEFVQNLEKNIKSDISQLGTNLSGGQKQRLALARTIITNPEIYIFDEATSNIDVESEEKVWESIYKLAKNKTVIVISHRLANVKNADSIYILDKGHIVENGKHKELMMSKNKYYELVTHQANLENIYKEDVEIEEPSTESALTLYTCTPLWTSKQRLVVRALPVEL